MRALFTKPSLLLPLIVAAGVAVLGLRVSDVRDAVVSGRLFARAAHAQAASGAAPDIAPPTLAPPASVAAKPADDAAKPSPDAAPASGTEDMSPAEMEVLKQLSARREELDRRANDIDSREALMKVAEQRVDQKIKEMETLRVQLQSMVNQASEAQAAQLENLVKVYETMKPDDAAKIFETLDMPVLLNVVQRMKPKSIAPILAKMVPEKAKEVTVALTRQDQLPQVK